MAGIVEEGEVAGLQRAVELLDRLLHGPPAEVCERGDVKVHAAEDDGDVVDVVRAGGDVGQVLVGAIADQQRSLSLLFLPRAGGDRGDGRGGGEGAFCCCHGGDSDRGIAEKVRRRACDGQGGRQGTPGGLESTVLWRLCGRVRGGDRGGGDTGALLHRRRHEQTGEGQRSVDARRRRQRPLGPCLHLLFLLLLILRHSCEEFCDREWATAAAEHRPHGRMLLLLLLLL
mmetsp:Transcript_3588/g.12664  ORF Transcript_3588/g.12664 Transcript_3588/m.12664 type:complete len:229 (-) Transcript_3588:20-706(-)